MVKNREKMFKDLFACLWIDGILFFNQYVAILMEKKIIPSMCVITEFCLIILLFFKYKSVLMDQVILCLGVHQRIFKCGQHLSTVYLSC